jgi:type IV pilus assembly protein PilY1
MKKMISPYASFFTLIYFTFGGLIVAQAAPGTLANAPLYLTTAVEPNIMFLLDDSGSMEWEFLAQGETDGIPNISSLDRYYILPSANNGRDQAYSPNKRHTTPSVNLVADAWRARNSSYNKLYYNPTITYTPWDGVDASGVNLYANASPTAARVNPNNATGTLDLTSNINFNVYVSGTYVSDTVFPAQYYTWSDSNTNGLVDNSDTHDLVEIKSTTSSYTKASTRSDCVSTTCTYTEEIQNFANWYTYYRKRGYAAKKALGNVIDNNSGARMGLYTYNNGLILNASSMSTASNKLALLESTYGATIVCDSTDCPGTPARTALKALGNLYEGSSSPILSAATGGTCQKNFSIVATDGYWNGGSPGVGNTDGGTSNTSFDGGTYADTYSNTLADVAMDYYERDLKTSLANNVSPTEGIDAATHQHMVTYTIAFGVTGTLNPATAVPTSGGTFWPDPTAGDLQKIDDTWHAAYNGRGLFLSAQNPETLRSSLLNALTNIAERASTATAAAFNSTSLSSNSVVYQAKFDPVKWSGELLAFPISTSGAISTTPIWNAATQLSAQLPANRVILSYNPSTNTGIPFLWDTAVLSSTQQADLNQGVTAADGRGAARVAYLRGDRSNEGSASTEFRIRNSSSVLGDIAQSNPVFVGKAIQTYPDTAPFPTGSAAYSTFKNSQAQRAGVVYVGANDGMLHGFSASTGNEVIAYAPHNLFSANASEGLHYLTEKTYGHRYYVDLGPSISDAYIKTTTNGTVGWKTVLVGGERGGGRGLFALDITNPNTFSQSGSAPDDIVMWEFTHADLGYTYSEPTISLMNNGRWAAIFGNGYNDTGAGIAKLFIVYLDGGLDGVWTLGSDYLILSTGVGSTTARNGLASPALTDMNNDKVVDRIYAGDLRGNMWAFDVSSSNDANWEVAYKTGMTPKPLFTARSAANVAQPITTRPAIARHASVPFSTSNSPNFMVYFGTGQYIASGDTANTATQTYYGVWDNGSKEIVRADLTAQTVTTSGDTRTLSSSAVNYNTKKGWYIDLDSSTAATGERVAVDSLIRDDEVHFNTLIPSSTICGYGGSSWLMRVNRNNGGQTTTPAFDTNGDGVISLTDEFTSGVRKDSIASKTVSIEPGVEVTCYTDGTCSPEEAKPHPGPTAGRQSWRELVR